MDFNAYKPSVLLIGHMQTVQTQIRLRIMRCLIRIFTICLRNVLIKIWKKMKIPPNFPKIGHELALLISVGKSIRIERVKFVIFFSNPNTGENGPSSVTTWPQYDTLFQRFIRLRTNTSSLPIEDHYAAPRMHFWNNLVPILQDNCDKICQPYHNKTAVQPVFIG